MTAVAAAQPALLAAIHVDREPPDTALAGRYGGEPMVQAFRVTLPSGATGRCWMPDSAALAIPGFGSAWVAGQIAARVLLTGEEAVATQLGSRAGLRLDTD